MSVSRRKFSSEFKSKVVLESLKEFETIESLAKKYEIHPTQVSQWRSQALKNFGSVFGSEFKKEDSTKEKDPPVKVNITTDEEALGERTKAKCILQFRPNDTYDGKYGFDWIRIGDTNKTGVIPPIHNNALIPWNNNPAAPAFASAGDQNDFAFEDYMGMHYYNGSHTDWTKTLRNSDKQIEHDGNGHGNTFKYDKLALSLVDIFRPDFVLAGSWSYTRGTDPIKKNWR